MNICIFFILFNGAAFVTPDCYTKGITLTPQDVVLLQHLPQLYIDIVYNAPHYYYRSHHRKKRYIKHWRDYNYKHNYYRPIPLPRVQYRHYNRRGKLKPRTTTRRYH